jgi:hypothetical protein
MGPVRSRAPIWRPDGGPLQDHGNDRRSTWSRYELHPRPDLAAALATGRPGQRLYVRHRIDAVATTSERKRRRPGSESKTNRPPSGSRTPLLATRPDTVRPDM